MTSPASIPALPSIPALRGLPDGVLRELINASREVRFRPGEVIRPAGEPAPHVVLLLAGTIAAVSGDVWTEHWQGPAIADKAAVLAGGPQPTGLVAASAVTARLLPAARFLDLLAEHHHVRDHVLHRLAADVTAGRDRIIQASVQPALARIAGWLHGRAGTGEVAWRGSQDHLARLLGLSRVTVNRALGRLSRTGAIHLTTHGVVIADPERLRAHTEW